MGGYGLGKDDRAQLNSLWYPENPPAPPRAQKLPPRNPGVNNSLSSSDPPWIGIKPVRGFMQQTGPSPVYHSAVSLASNNIHQSRPRSAKRPMDPRPGSGEYSNTRSSPHPEAPISKKPRIGPEHRLSWKTKPSSQDTHIDRAVEGRKVSDPGGSGANPIMLKEDDEEDDVGQPYTRAANGDADPRRLRGLPHTSSTRTTNRILPSKHTMQPSSNSSDELDLLSPKASGSKEPVYGHRHTFDSVTNPTTSNGRSQGTKSNYKHDSVPRNRRATGLPFNSSITAADPGRLPSLISPDSKEVPRSPSWQGFDDCEEQEVEASSADTIESFGSDLDITEQPDGGRLSKSSRAKGSPSIRTITPGNTQAKVEQLKANDDGPWRENADSRKFVHDVRTQQSLLGQPRMRASERMRGKDAQAQIDAIVLSDEELPRVSPRVDARFAAPLDHPAMAKPMYKQNGQSAKASVQESFVPVECLYFGGHRIVPATRKKRFKLKWTPYLFSLVDHDGKPIAHGLFKQFHDVTINDTASGPAICILRGNDEFLNKARSYFSRGLSLKPDTVEIALKLDVTDNDYSSSWDRLKKSIPPPYTPANPPSMDWITSSTAGRLIDKAERECALFVFDTKAPTRPSGTPISMPSNPSRAIQPSRSAPHSLTYPRTPQEEVNRQQPIVQATTRETRSTTRNKDSGPMYSVFGNRAPSPDPNELMLVWPLDTKTGAVHISNGDFKRLEPQEFLNDTLIEFGLKLWFQNFSEKHPEVARDVHMFNTFFYKKISNKDFKAGYESVKKWTNKVNIFSKKYIIVPINEHLHWYLAIIYNPRGILRPPLPAAIRTPRKSARLSMAKPSPEPVEVSTPTSEQSSGAVDEAEVELQVEDVNMEDADTTPFAVSDRGPSEHQVDYMEVDSPREMPPVTVANREVSPELGEALPVRHTDKQAPTIMAPQPPPEALYIPEVSDVGDEETFIFTFDSLGGPHKGAIKFLSRYLQAEAEHKLEKRETREGIGKKARVPIQQNFCDCGLFVLHFVEKFMEKPEEFIREFLVNEKKSAEKKPVDYWDRMWDREAVNDKRNLLKAEIESLASEWKQRKEAHAQDEAQKGKEKEASVMPSGEDTAQGSKSDEDSDVEIVGESRKTLPTRGGKKGQVDNRRGVATARVAAATPEELRRSRGENDHRHAGPQARAVSRAADEPSQEVTAVPGPAESAKIRAQRPTPRLPLNGNRFIRK